MDSSGFSCFWSFFTCYLRVSSSWLSSHIEAPSHLTPQTLRFPWYVPSLYLITVVICTNLVSFIEHSGGIHFSRILNGTSSLISVLLFCLHAKRILHHYTILMEYDRIFVSSFGLHRFNVHSTHISTWGVYCLATFLDLRYLSQLVTLHLRLKISLEPWLQWALRPRSGFVSRSCTSDSSIPSWGSPATYTALLEARLSLQVFSWIWESRPQ